MKLNEILSLPFADWFRPILFVVVALPIGVICSLSGLSLLELFGAVLFFVSVMWLFASMLFLLFTKEWRKGLYTFLFVVTVVVVLGLLG